MVDEGHYGEVLGGPAVDLVDFPKPRKVLLDYVLSVERWRDVLANEGGAVGRRHAAQAVRALGAYATFHRGRDFSCWIRSRC